MDIQQHGIMLVKLWLCNSPAFSPCQTSQHRTSLAQGLLSEWKLGGQTQTNPSPLEVETPKCRHRPFLQCVEDCGKQCCRALSRRGRPSWPKTQGDQERGPAKTGGCLFSLGEATRQQLFFVIKVLSFHQTKQHKRKELGMGMRCPSRLEFVGLLARDTAASGSIPLQIASYTCVQARHGDVSNIVHTKKPLCIQQTKEVVTADM